MIADTFAAVDNLCKSFEVSARKAVSAGATSAGPYATSSATQQQPFADSQSLANAAKQYGALRDIPYTAIRPIAVKVASQEILLGYKDTSEKTKEKLSPAASRLRTKSLTYELAPPFMRKKIAEGLDPVEDHFLLDVLENPNPYTSGWALKYCTAMSLSATGDAFWLIDRGPAGAEGQAGAITGFWYLPKTWVTPVHDPVPFAAYKIRPPGEPDRTDLPNVPAADMIHFRYPDPGNPLGSMSPLQTQARAVNTDDEIQKAQLASMRNSIHPSVILRAGRLPPKPGETGQGPLPVLTPEQRRQLTDSIRLHASGAMHFGDPLIIDGMIEGVEQFSRSPAELDFPNGSGLTKDRIMQGLGVNPIVAGQIQDANRASAYVAHKGFFDLVVNPVLALMSATLTARLSGADPTAGRKLYIWLEEAVAEDADLNLAKMTGAQTAMAVTKNEWREFCQLPKSDDPEADKLPKPPEPAPLGKPPGVSSSKPKPKPGGKRKSLRRKQAHDFFVKGLLSGIS